MTTALYRRYRPDTFDQVIGQEHVTEPLKAALRANRVTHAYLFSGPRGCGKTTSARILARCLNCAQGPTPAPCGQCESCRELATGGPGSLDVVEIDAASHGGVDDARDLRERATFAPVRDRYKIFIIDEAHMVTNQGFNALLKLVEEPPEHVKFVFATTEPERVIGTIRSRTHHYPFRLVPPDVLGPYLNGLCGEENVVAAEGVLSLVMRAGGGSVRDTLSVLDQLMAGSTDGQISYQTAVALLGYTDSALLDQSVDALAGGDGAAAFRVVERMVESGHDPRRFVEDLLQRLRDLLIIAVAGDSARDVLADVPGDQFARMQVQAQNWGPSGLSRAADLTDEALRAMTGATSPRLQLELLVGRILVPAPAADGSPVQGTVGMVGGGAPRQESTAAPQASSGRFGAREAREALARKTQERRGSAAPTSSADVYAGRTDQPGAPAWGEGPDWSSVTPAAPTRERTTRAPGSAQEGSAQPAPQAASQVTREASVRPARHPGRARTDAQPSSSQVRAPAAHQGAAPLTAEAPAASGRDADMLHGRWNEVVERLASISRVTWSMVGTNAQLGAVDGTRAILLFPVEAMVNAFERGPRAADVEKAIAEVTGLHLSVAAQVGQASGGPASTVPSAQASHRAPAAHPSQPGGWVSEPPPFDEAAAQAAPPKNPEPAPRDAASEDAFFVSHPTDTGTREATAAPAAAPRKRSFTVFRYPGDPEGTEENAEQPHSASVRQDDEPEVPPTAPVFDDAPIEAAHAPATPTGWGNPVVIPGGASVSFDDPDDTWSANTTSAPASAESEEAAPSSSTPAWLAAAAQPAQPTAPTGVNEAADASHRRDNHETPLTGRAAAEAALREKTQRAQGSTTRTHAADDDSASIDDENIENSQMIGLAAVLEILGGRVIEEKMTEGEY